jgi:prepilin-type N-terminal cleavage/methylation domain-containing protein
MRLGIAAKTNAFTLTEMIIAIAIASTILAVTLTSSIALQKSFNEVDNYSTTHMQQIRIVDYLARDVRRGLSVTSSLDMQTVTITIPRYIIQAGDAEAIGHAELIGTPRSPTRAIVREDLNINYAATTSTVVYCISNSQGTDCNVLGNPAGKAILRKEDGVTTTIASSTDNLIPATTDIELANTEYTTTAVTFKPISLADRNGTIVYSTAYLRNRRRPVPTPTPGP